MVKPSVLLNFDPGQPIRLKVDSSSFGLGVAHLQLWQTYKLIIHKLKKIACSCFWYGHFLLMLFWSIGRMLQGTIFTLPADLSPEFQTEFDIEVVEKIALLINDSLFFQKHSDLIRAST